MKYILLYEKFSSLVTESSLKEYSYARSLKNKIPSRFINAIESFLKDKKQSISTKSGDYEFPISFGIKPKTNFMFRIDLRQWTHLSHELKRGLLYPLTINIVVDNDNYYYVNFEKIGSTYFYKCDDIEGVIEFLKFYIN